MNKYSINVIIGFLIVLLSANLLDAQYRCDWNVFSNGGGILTSANYQCRATAVQPAIGNMASSNMLGFIGFWLPVTPTAILEPKTEEVFNPNQLITKLYNAKPNPFRNLTTIYYSLSTKTKVSLNIYDVSGRLVKTLVNGEQTPGFYNVMWNSQDNQNQLVSKGVYFYRLHTSNYNSSKKLVIIQ
ncbi:MAG: T9SS type A sorting domain-containing protein [candidate division WOR-3 bacterium]|nr:T9SS type A sorting domain-containing protein [candidate division WOR-3 bacterium]